MSPVFDSDYFVTPRNYPRSEVERARGELPCGASVGGLPWAWLVHDTRHMRQRTIYITREATAESSTNLLMGFVAGMLVGALGGYVIGTQITPRAVAAAAATAPSPASAPIAALANDQELQTYRNILAADPKNVRAAVELGNRLYDAGRFAEAVPYYQQAHAVNPNDVNVSTDLGTSLWNSGRTDEALAQFDRSLKVNATHPQTLFNVGIVRLNGKNDPAGAVAAWERLLSANPSYPEESRVRAMIAEAKGRLKPLTTSRVPTFD